MASHGGCGGTGQCGCGSRSQQDLTPPPAPVARVNGQALHAPGEQLHEQELHQRAYGELLRQAAQAQGLLDAAEPAPQDGVLSEAAVAAIEALLARSLQLAEPDETACRRYYEAHPQRFAQGERVQASHILVAVTPGVDVAALRAHAEGLLLRLRCEDEAAFAAAARENSNCPSGEQGGRLGWLVREDCMPELGSALFGQDEANRHLGVLPRLVSSRHGFHIIRVQDREAGARPPFETVRQAVAALLTQQQQITATRQYLDLLAGAAQLEGLALGAAESPLVQ